MFWTKGGIGDAKQANILLCDMNGFIYRRLHYGHHGSPKYHNFGTKEQPFYYHAHDIAIKDKKPVEIRRRGMSEEEVRCI